MLSKNRLCVQRKASAAICVGLFAAAALLYANTLPNSFVFDDIPLIVENRSIERLTNIPRVLGLTTGRPMYRPVRYVSYMLDYAVAGRSLWPYHVSNILYHGAASCMVFRVILLLSGSLPGAVAASLLFAAHPVQTDSVAYISGRRDILSAFFFLLGFYCFLRFRGSGRVRFFVLTVLWFVCAVGSKEMAVTLPAVCLLYDIMGAVRQRESWPPKRLLRHLWPYAVLAAGAGWYLYYKLILHYPSLRTDFYGGGAAGNFATVLRIIVRYLKLLPFPVVLHADYSYNAFPVSRSFMEPRVLAAAALVAAVLGVVVLSARRRPLVFFGGLWFFVTLLPVCQIFPHHEILAEHYLYLPLVGFLIALTPLLASVLEQRKRASCAVLAVVLVLFSVRTVIRNRDWKDSGTLWSTVLETTPACARAQDNMGTACFKRGEYKLAESHYSKAVELRPQHAIFRNNLGMALGAMKDLDGAGKQFQKALRLAPGLAAAYNNLGIIYFMRRDYSRAAWLFWLSVLRKPDHRSWLNCGKAALKLGNTQGAVDSFRRAVRMNPAYAEEHYYLGVALRAGGRPQRARAAFQRAIALKPDYAPAYRDLAALFFYELHDHETALRLVQKSLALQASSPQSLRLLGEVQEKRGERQSALKAYRSALALSPEDPELLYRLAAVYKHKNQDRQRALWYFKRALRHSQDPGLRKRVQQEISSLQ